MPTYCGGSLGERGERANKIVLCLRCLLSGYIKGWFDINDVLFGGLRKEWLSKINGLRHTEKIFFRKAIKRCCGENAMRNDACVRGADKGVFQFSRPELTLRMPKRATGYCFIFIFLPISQVSVVILEIMLTEQNTHL